MSMIFLLEMKLMNINNNVPYAENSKFTSN